MSLRMSDLVQTLEDGRVGFEKAAERLSEQGDQTVAQQFRGFSAERARMSQELQRAAEAAGEDFSDKPSIAGAIHRGWVGLKDTLTGDDADAIVKAAKSAEEYAVNRFEAALDDDDLDPTVRTVVQKDLIELRQVKEQVERIAD